MALFWGNTEVVDLLGVEPRNPRVAAGLGLLERIRELAGTPQAGAHCGFYRPDGGFRAWQPSDDPQEVLDEALVWAAQSDRVAALPMLVELGARLDANPYRGMALTWRPPGAASVQFDSCWILAPIPNARATFGRPSHGEGVTALHLAAQSGHVEAAQALLEGGADATIRHRVHDCPT